MSDKLHFVNLTREQAKANLLKADPRMTNKDMDELINVMEEEYLKEGPQKIKPKTIVQLPKKESYFSEFHRPYCSNCKRCFGFKDIMIERCPKCKEQIVIRSFNPFAQIFWGFIVLVFCVLFISMLFSVLVAGGYVVLILTPALVGFPLLGVVLISTGIKDFSMIYKLDNVSI